MEKVFIKSEKYLIIFITFKSNATIKKEENCEKSFYIIPFFKIKTEEEKIIYK